MDAVTIARENYEEVRKEAYKGAMMSIQGVINIPPPAPKDNVNHPTHYSRWAMEPVEFIAINNLNWWQANVTKYIMRYDEKDGLQDLYKARSYLDMAIRMLEGTKRFWEKPVAEERKANGKG